MLGTTQPDDVSMPVRRGVSRRSVLRISAATAWTVPVISVVAVAPAHAVGSGPAVLQLSGVVASHAMGSRTVTVTTQVANVGGQATVNLQLTAVVTGGNYGGATSNTPSGWTLSSSTKNSANQVTFVYTSIGQIAADGTQAFNPIWTLPSSAKNNPGNATLTATTTGGTPGASPLIIPATLV